MSNSKHIAVAKTVLKDEADALTSVASRLGESFHDAIELIVKTEGKVIVTGVGKSGLVGRKMAATFASLGTPSVFVHPTEAYHGDLGVISPKDVCIAISNSGNTEEILRLVPSLKLMGVSIIGICATAQSELGRVSDLVLETGVHKEACALNLAPTTSTTVTIALGDAMAVALVNAKGFTERDFAFFHPGGTLGRKLLTRVADVMLPTDKVGKAALTDGAKVLAEQMSVSNLGLVVVLDAKKKVLGIVTDGDLRRAVQRGDIDRSTAEKLMTRNPKTISKDRLVTEAVRLAEKHRIKALLVSGEDGTLEGALNLHDVMNDKLFS